MFLASSGQTAPLQKAQLTSTKGQQQQMLTSDNCLPHSEKQGPLKSNKSQEIMEAMSKLDAKLVSYLVGADDISPAAERSTCEQLSHDLPLNHLMNNVSETKIHKAIFPHQRELLRHITSIRLQMEALTLQAEGTKRMELLQNDIRPICTVECQLSNEIIKGVPRHNMFHIMQFESEKFNSLTQCTRFGQEAERKVRFHEELEADNFGEISFTVWWREPGTCLSEILGMGVLELKELFYASLLEKCMCIEIKRRSVHLASIYFKISLQLQQFMSASVESLKLQEPLNLNAEKQCGNNANGEEEKAKCHTNELEKQTEHKADCGLTSAPVGGGNSDSDKSAAGKLLELESTEFTIETSKVRLLKGFLYASETCNFEMLSNCDHFLVCRRFWSDEAGAAMAGADNKFNYQEQFSVINDEQFLNRVNMCHLQLEVWRRRQAFGLDRNGNAAGSNAEALGSLQLPLHQFFIAYRDAAITNHLWKAQLPVISIDAWVPITCARTRSVIGKIKCVLAIGSEEQITNLKRSRAFEAAAVLVADKALFAEQSLICAAQHNSRPPAQMPSVNGTALGAPQLRRTSDLLDMLQNVLAQPRATAAPPPCTKRAKSTCNAAPPPLPPPVDGTIGQLEDSLGLTHLNLGQAIKRKFGELEQISQRLRTRLTDVTGAPLAPNFDISMLDDWQPLQESNGSDVDLDEFEHDINSEIAATCTAKPVGDAAVTPAKSAADSARRDQC